MKRLFLFAAIITAHFAANGQDVICRTVRFQIGPGIYFDSTFCFPVAKPIHDTIRVTLPDTIYVEAIRWQTDSIYVPVYKTDTVYKCPEIPKPVATIKDTISTAKILFKNANTQTFENYNINLTDPSGIAFYSYTKDLAVNLTLRNIKQRGGGNTIWSSMTGAVGKNSTFLIENSDLRTNTAPIAIYSAYDLVGRVTVRNTFLSAVISHGAYINANIPVTMENVHIDSLSRGINSEVACSFQHFTSTGVPGFGKDTSYFKGCYGPAAHPWRFAGHTYLDTDTMTLYDTRRDGAFMFLHARNSFLEKWFKGDAYNISGKDLMLYDTAFINGATYATLTVDSGNYIIRGLKVTDIFGISNTPIAGKAVNITFIDCELGYVAGIPKGSVWTLVRTKKPLAKWGNPYQPIYIEQVISTQ